MTQERTVVYENNEIHYLLEQKLVKNLNLRVHHWYYVRKCRPRNDGKSDPGEQAWQ